MHESKIFRLLQDTRKLRVKVTNTKAKIDSSSKVYRSKLKNEVISLISNELEGMTTILNEQVIKLEQTLNKVK